MQGKGKEKDERGWFHIFARKLGYENPNFGRACRDYGELK
jgi:hypothetical protein